MSGANNILPFCPTDTGTNLLSQAAYLAAAGRTQGNQPGTASSQLVNKSLRQASLVAAAVAQYIADRQLTDLVDTDTAANIASYFETAMINKTIATVGGTSDAITLAMTPTATALVGGLVGWRATSANATSTPTVKRDGLAAKTLVKGNNLPLGVADIPGAGSWMWSQYDATLDKEVLLNPAGGVGGAVKQIQPIATPTQSAGAMTIPAVTFSLDFRNPTLASGGVSTVTGTAAALVIPSGATLGTVSAQPSSIVDVVINNAGTLERAVVNLSGGNDLSETGVISTTAISAGSTSANVFYSTTARSNVSYRVVGRYDSTQATAGTWASLPTLVQGMGGNALSSMSSLGYGQTWQNVPRSPGTTYYNTTGKPIISAVRADQSFSGGAASWTINGVSVVAGMLINANGGSYPGGANCVIPAGASYVFSVPGTYVSSQELR